MDPDLDGPQPKLRSVQLAKEALLKAIQEAIDDSSSGLSNAAHVLTQPPRLSSGSSYCRAADA